MRTAHATSRSALLLLVLASALLTTGCRTSSGWMMNNSGLGYYQRGNYAMARHEFYRAVVHQPRKAQYRHNLAMAMMRQGDVAGAEQVLRHNLTIDAMHQPTYHSLAELMIQKGRPDEAYALMENWAGTQPYLPEAHVEMAWVQRQIGDETGAEQQLRQALQLDPQQPFALAQLGDMYQQAGQTDRAAALYQRSLARRWNQPQVQSRLATVSGRRGRMDRLTRSAWMASPLPGEPATGGMSFGNEMMALNGAAMNGGMISMSPMDGAMMAQADGTVMSMPSGDMMMPAEATFAATPGLPGAVGETAGFDPVLQDLSRRQQRKLERQQGATPYGATAMMPAGIEAHTVSYPNLGPETMGGMVSSQPVTVGPLTSAPVAAPTTIALQPGDTSYGGTPTGEYLETPSIAVPTPIQGATVDPLGGWMPVNPSNAGANSGIQAVPDPVSVPPLGMLPSLPGVNAAAPAGNPQMAPPPSSVPGRMVPATSVSLNSPAIGTESGVMLEAPEITQQMTGGWEPAALRTESAADAPAEAQGDSLALHGPEQLASLPVLDAF